MNKCNFCHYEKDIDGSFITVAEEPFINAEFLVDKTVTIRHEFDESDESGINNYLELKRNTELKIRCEVFIEDGNQLTAAIFGDSYYDWKKIEIKYCPMCGRKLAPLTKEVKADDKGKSVSDGIENN